MENGLSFLEMKTEWYTVKIVVINLIVAYLWSVMNLGQLVVGQDRNFLNDSLKYARIVIVNYVVEIKWRTVKNVDMNRIVERLVPILLVLVWQINMSHVNVIIVVAYYVTREKNPGPGQVFRRENGRNRLC